MGHTGGQDILGKGQMCCSYQNRTPDISAHRINTVFLFIITFIADFNFNVLECEMLNIKDERYTMYEAKESALKWRSQDRKLIWKDKINSRYCDLKY